MQLPHYATLPIRVALWALIGLVLLVAVWAFTASVPRYASGRAVVVDTETGPLIMALFPSGERGQLHEGDPLTVTFDRSPEPVLTRVSCVLPAAQPPEAQDCLLLDASRMPEEPPGDLPARVVATFPASAAVVPARSTGQAAVETGQESLLSWIAS